MDASDDYFNSIMDEFDCVKEMEDVLDVEGDLAFLETDLVYRTLFRV
jgi:hypothetical protein